MDQNGILGPNKPTLGKIMTLPNLCFGQLFTLISANNDHM